MQIDDSKLSELEAEHGEVFVLTEGGETAVFKRPTRAQYRRFRSERLDDRKASTALETLFSGCLVYPPAKEFDAVIDRKPALPDLFASKLLDVASGAEDPAQKK